jgi:PAS domain S-box-containing protein
VKKDIFAFLVKPQRKSGWFMQDQLIPLSSGEEIRLQAQLLNVIEQAIMAVDLSGRVVFWNHFAETLFGWTGEEVQGRNLDEVFASPFLMDLVRTNLAQIRNGQSLPVEFPLQRQDGTVIEVNVSILLIQSQQRAFVCLAGNIADSSEHKQLQEANRLLEEASTLLLNAVDYEAPLMTLAQLAVPQIADWCAVYLQQANGSIEQVALAPVEMAKLQAAHDWLQKHLPNDDANGLPAVLRSGKPKLVMDSSLDLRAAEATIQSYMIVPLISPPKTLGAITFVAAESGRRFNLNDLALAENLASHFSIYLDKVRLYHEGQQLNVELEKRVSERTAELRAAITQLEQSEATIQTLFRISTKLNATLEVGKILDELAQEAIRIVNGESGFAGLRTANGMTVRKYFRQGLAIPFEYTWPLGEGIPGWVLEHKVSYGTSDAAHDPVIQQELSINTGVRSMICTPILDSMGEVLGYFDIRNKQDTEGFSIQDQNMLMALAPAASIAIQNALAYQQRLATVADLKESSRQFQALAANLELAREEERTQIARELHDQL